MCQHVCGSLLGSCVVRDVAVETLCLRALGRLEPRTVEGLLGLRAGGRVVCPARLGGHLMRVRL